MDRGGLTLKTPKCYIYTRVSTSMQVDGYSLDAQKDKLKKYAEFQGMVVAGEYSDEGKSGKNIEGRPQFMQMLKDIETGKDKVDFVLVFKLSRFGRNAADVLSSLQHMQDFGVNLICVEDGIDSSKDSGKLMISVLSAVAEIERENILVQTMEGRRQKAREGKWNGGFAPYGYKLENGELLIAEDEAEVIRIIYDKFVNTTMGASAIATYLNERGYVKKKRQNNTLDMFSAHFIKLVLDNPIYCGKLAYGRRKNEKIAGTRNEYHIVKQDEYPVYDGVHEAIVPEEVWQLAQRKRQATGVKSEKIYNLEHENILSGILRCPVCGAAMYGNVNRKKKGDGTHYRDYYYYSCKHRTTINGNRCGYRKQWKQEKIDGAVEEVIRKLVQNPKFEQAIRQKIGARIDTDELETELEQLRKKLRQLNGAKSKLGQQMDSLDILDKYYDRKYQDMEERLYKLYEEIDSVETQIEEVETRIINVRQQKISGDNIYQFLLYFDKLYDKFSDAEKKEFLNSFIERVDIYEQEQPDGRILKHIKFRFPVYFNGKEIEELGWDDETTVETVCLLSKLQSKEHIEIEVAIDEMDLTSAESKATYEEIREYVFEHTGLKVSHLYIAQVKQKYGIIERENYNKPKSENAKQPQCPPEKEKAITEALKHFGMI
ncbi:recombinase family protein [Intestinimonas sp. MSJ-38]|uniref:recombinase family protein n=1 Tax=Intestinimonas sp. MSJ-38 TaxID=2841532 RepID=UPI001C124968|nr:recombinase family protein [Intestinimonas sp. MSJ-38]MBU5431323.1 recombinase family protein [Intestinimonas sp. MSJ-38]